MTLGMFCVYFVSSTIGGVIGAALMDRYTERRKARAHWRAVLSQESA